MPSRSRFIQHEMVEQNKERIAKVMARAGLCSRRDAERWITDGRVVVNGENLTTPAHKVSEEDVVLVDGKPLPMKEKTRVWLYYKPIGLVTSARDEQGRRTVFDVLPKNMPRVISVGRLDLNSEGLLILTNDGALARMLELPSNKFERIYRVRVLGDLDIKKLHALKKGITVDGVRYGSIKVKVEDAHHKGANHWLRITLQEGKNREIRKVMEAVGLHVNRLIRLSYGPFNIGRVKRGTVQEIHSDVIEKLLQQAQVKN